MSSAQRSVRDDLERNVLLVKRSVAYWKRALGVFVLAAAIAVPVIFTRPRVYRSETVILYQETIRASDLTGGEAAEGGARRVGPRLREVLFSRASLEPIIRDLKLNPKASDPRTQIEAVDDLRKRITFRAREGDTFEIAYDCSNPEEAQQVTQRLGDCIIQEASQRRAERAQVLKEFLNAESQTNATDLRAKEGAMAAFESQHPALAMRLRQPSSSATPQPGPGGAASPTSGDPILNSLESRAARIDRQLAKAAQGQVPPPPPPPRPVFVPPPESGELIAARKDLADKLARYTDRHPDVIAARTRLKAAEDAQQALNQQAIDAHAAAVASANAAAATRDEPPPKNAADEAALRQQLNDLQGQIVARRTQLRGDGGVTVAAAELAGSNVALEVEFRRLDRDLAEARERQRQLDERLFKASITASSVMSDRNIQVTVLDPAYLPAHPISSPRSLSLAGALLAGLILALAVAIVSAKFDDRIYDKVDLERLDILPIVGVIPPAQLPSDKRSSG